MFNFDQPNANRHAQASFVKSFLRICAGIMLVIPKPFIVVAGIFFIIAEIVGIIEELV